MDASATGTKRMKGVRRKTPDAPSGPADGDDVLALMELLFFAYRDFIAEPDTMLAELGFGRAHHRVLHFIGRHPGLRVSELLAILRITKQSLGRVLRELVGRGYVLQEEGATDRRQRLLRLTPAGRHLLERLEAPQIARVRAALASAGEGARTAFVHALLGLVDEAEREHVAALCGLPTTMVPARQEASTEDPADNAENAESGPHG